MIDKSCTHRFGDLRWRRFQRNSLFEDTFSATTKVSEEHETQPIANLLLPAAFLFASYFYCKSRPQFI